ncbi:MAG: TaqI-like C-terminal specificity domain-containing protein [Candidatus Gracilibacteria bacterium]|nr:TaqI-like C-terminal specificity domain-containing protein [Candidatus Gracilibacteria bacterium]MDD2908386.1 TaqI-like C-terminal specificity domain-containing protein [Candidatus Gracilibacteria bacterium]
MAKLFKDNVIKEKLLNFEIPDFEKKIEILESWNNLYKQGKLHEKKETSIQGEFASHILGSVLGYKDFVENNEQWNRQNEPGNPTGGQSSDFGLGYFKSSKDFSQNLIKVVVEVKDTKTSLDKPQQRAGNLTPVQQAFKYKPYFNECDFIIVSNFYETRLYIDSYYDYESFTLSDLVDPKNNYFNFRKFYYLLGKENLITKSGDSNTKSLLSLIRIREKEITKDFYKEYTNLRKELFKDIVVNNPGFKKSELDFLLNKTQKIIDRIIFIHFCEDLGLLPQGKLKENLLRAEEIGFTPWEMLQKFFEFVNSGSEKLGIPDGYNGGLFKEDIELNKLKVGNDICKKFVDLGDYDFADDLSVNILGHIFEQSISDIEELKDKINKQEEATLSKRKKDGVFYTPEYIVDYIVKNSVGKKIDEWEEELKEKHSLKDDITDKNYDKRAILVYSELQEKVQNIKVLDPACGSGAFLVKVFDFLLDKNKEVSKKLEDLGINQGLFSSENYLKTILQNNIYGVDLNEESVEITKLSLWLKTAQKGKKLANLDSNIKCGNSLIDDKKIAGDKAFVWETEFKEIFDNDGFDVIVGNPPYVVVNKKDEISKLYEWNEDLYLMFFERVLKKLIKKEGYFGFITPRFFLVNKSNSNFRNFLINKVNLIQLIETSPFEDANTECVISVINFNKINKDIEILNDLDGNILYKSAISKEIINKNEDFLINTTLTGIQNSINIKIEENTKKISDISISKRGMELGKPFLREEKSGIEALIGQDINKYSLNFENTYISENNQEYIRLKNFFIGESIYLRRVAKEIIAYLGNNFAYNKNIYGLKIIDNNFSIKYILTLLNSSLITFYYKSKFSTKKGDLFPEIQTYLYNQLPIKNIPLSEQTSFVEKADFMLDKNKELQEKVNKFLNRLKSSFGIEKFSNKLEGFYNLSFTDFVKELAKNKVNLSLKDQDEWDDYLDSFKKEVLELKSRIDSCDKEIDEMVFDLYGLNKEERKVVLGE